MAHDASEQQQQQLANAQAIANMLIGTEPDLGPAPATSSILEDLELEQESEPSAAPPSAAKDAPSAPHDAAPAPSLSSSISASADASEPAADSPSTSRTSSMHEKPRSRVASVSHEAPGAPPSEADDESVGGSSLSAQLEAQVKAAVLPPSSGVYPSGDGGAPSGRRRTSTTSSPTGISRRRSTSVASLESATLSPSEEDVFVRHLWPRRAPAKGEATGKVGEQPLSVLDLDGFTQLPPADDALGNIVRRHLGAAGMSRRRPQLTFTDVDFTVDGLVRLMAMSSWSAAVKHAEKLLTTATVPDVEGRMQVFLCRQMSLYALRRYDIMAKEIAAFGPLTGDNDYIPHVFTAGSPLNARVSAIPMALRILHAVLPADTGNLRESVQRLSALKQSIVSVIGALASDTELQALISRRDGAHEKRFLLVC